jgi:hypothetical protein
MRLVRILGTAVAAVVAVGVAGARAQDTEGHVHPYGERRFAFGGDVAVTGAPREDAGFFNNTDYDINGTRMVRLRVFGEWRLGERISIVGDLRTENTDHLVLSPYIRWRPWPTRGLVVQAGRIPPVFGAFPRRPYGRDNLTLAVPLAYQYLTSLRPDALPRTTGDLLQMRGRGWQPSFPVGSTAVRGGVALMSLASWDTGVEAGWQNERFSIAGAVTRGSPAVPVVQDSNDGVGVSGRVAYRSWPAMTVGVSMARAQWLESQVLLLSPGGRDAPSSQTLVGLDAEAGWGPWLARAEWVHARFDLPTSSVETLPSSVWAHAGFVEARYRGWPRWQIGLRAERITFEAISTPAVAAGTPWDAPVARLEGVLGYRATRRLEIRAGWQHNWRDGGRIRRWGTPLAGVFYWF